MPKGVVSSSLLFHFPSPPLFLRHVWAASVTPTKDNGGRGGRVVKKKAQVMVGFTCRTCRMRAHSSGKSGSGASSIRYCSSVLVTMFTEMRRLLSTPAAHTHTVTWLTNDIQTKEMYGTARGTLTDTAGTRLFSFFFGGWFWGVQCMEQCMDQQHSSKDNNDKHKNKISKNVVSAKRH